MLKRFTLAEEFTNPELERSLLAAIAANPDVYWEVLDLLPPEALTETRQVRALERNHVFDNKKYNLTFIKVLCLLNSHLQMLVYAQSSGSCHSI
jgi:hypothetical protein